MIKNYLKLTLYVYYCSLIALSILYLFPGSLIGYLLYGDFGKQPNLIPNPLGTSINHALAFFYISILSLLTYKKKEDLKKTIIFLVSLSIILEISHFFIPNRSFQSLDLFANLVGSLIGVFIVILFKKYKRRINK
tara:strand:- start:8 stop:412 length:405 start_codon:yes stop_codon:yes gene_type:complete